MWTEGAAVRVIKKVVKGIYGFSMYPGYRSLAFHRFSNLLYRKKMVKSAFFISQCSRFLSGIEIEPGAKMSDSVIISHGMGVVIGYSACVGENVLIRQGVTLGAGNYRPEDSSVRIHPVIEDFCAIGAGAVVLGPITIGHHSVIGANSVVTKDVEPYSVVAGAPAKLIRRIKDTSGMPWTFE